MEKKNGEYEKWPETLMNLNWNWFHGDEINNPFLGFLSFYGILYFLVRIVFRVYFFDSLPFFTPFFSFFRSVTRDGRRSERDTAGEEPEDLTKFSSSSHPHSLRASHYLKAVPARSAFHYDLQQSHGISIKTRKHRQWRKKRVKTTLHHESFPFSSLFFSDSVPMGVRKQKQIIHSWTISHTIIDQKTTFLTFRVRVQRKDDEWILSLSNFEFSR